MDKPLKFASDRRLNLHYFVMQAGYWAMFAAFCGYQTALLLGRGFSNSEVGVILAARCLAGVVAQPILGGWADRHPLFPLKGLVCLCLAVSFGANLVLIGFPGMSLWETMAVFGVIGAFEISIYPLMDSMAIQFINVGVNIRYSLGRGIGSMSYAVFCLYLGWQTARFGLESYLWAHLAVLAVEVVLILTFPTFHARPRPAPGEGPQPQSVLRLLRTSPRFTLMLLAVFLGLTAYMPTTNFLINILEGRGGGTGQLGAALFWMAAWELPAAFLFQRLYRRWGSGRVMVVAMAAIAVKAGLFLLSPGWAFIFLFMPVQILGYGLFTPDSVFFVNEAVPRADRGRGQSLMMVASNGLGGMMGSLLPGAVLDWAGVDAMLLLCAALGAASTLLALAAFRMKGPAEH